MSILLVTGYRRTGKDTLYSMLTKQQPFRWLVYRKYHDELTDVQLQAIFIDNISWMRVSFAEQIKLEILDWINSKYETNHSLISIEKVKDDKLFEGKSFRDLCISRGEEMRMIDKDYWCKLALTGADGDIVVTDWRFTNEADYVLSQPDKTSTRTVRLFRSEVPIPDLLIETEHDLDNYQTDLLLVTSEAEFNKAVELFPQYQDYTQLML